MNRELNRYRNIVSGEILNVIEMNNFVSAESKRQYEENTGDLWCNLTISEQQDCILEQWEHQIKDGDWEVLM